jgi:hypothetical protein
VPLQKTLKEIKQVLTINNLKMKKYLLFLILGFIPLMLKGQPGIYKRYDIKTLYVPTTQAWAAATTGKSDSVTYNIQAPVYWSLQVQPVSTGTDSVYAAIKGYVSNTDSIANIWTQIKVNDNSATNYGKGDTLVIGNSSLTNNSAWKYDNGNSCFQNVRIKFVISQLAATHKSVKYKIYFVAKNPVATLATH